MGGGAGHAIGQTDGESSLSPRVELHFILEYSDHLAVLSILLESRSDDVGGHCRVSTLSHCCPATRGLIVRTQ